MLVIYYNDILNDLQEIADKINKLKPDDNTEQQQIELLKSHNDHNIELIKVIRKRKYNISAKEDEEDQKVKPAPDVHPLEYLNNISWLDNILDNKIKELRQLHEKTLNDPKLCDFYSKLSPFTQKHFYNNDQINILHQIVALIEHYLIFEAYKAGRYNSKDGSWFIGAGIDVYYKDSPQRKKNAVKKRIYSLGYGDGDGADTKLRDISDIFKHFNIDVLHDHGRMD